MKGINKIFFTLAFILSSSAAYCQINVTVCDRSSRFPITKYTSYLQSAQQITIDSVLKVTSLFKNSGAKPVIVFNYDPYYYWFRVIVNNPQPKSRKLMLLMAPVGLNDGKLFQRVDGKWDEVAHTGLKYKFEDRSYQFTHHVFPFTLKSKTTDTLYISINATNVYKSFGFALINPKELKVFENNIYFVFGILVGLLLLFLAVNIGLFIALRERLHLWYSLYIALLILIVMKNDHLDQQFLGLDSERAFRLTPYMTIGALAIAVLLHVVQVFLRNILVKSLILQILNKVLMLNVVGSAIVHFFVFNTATDYHIHTLVFNWARLSTSLGIFMIIINCLYSVLKGFKGALFIFFGSLVFMIGSVQRIYFPSTLSFLFPPTTFHVGIIVETVVVSMGLIYSYWVAKNNLRQRENNFTRELQKSQLEIQEQTFKTISEDIHDNIGQMLTLAKLNLNSIDTNNAETTREKIDDVSNTVARVIQDLRSLAKTLNSDTITRIGIAQAIQVELEAIEKITGIETDFNTTDIVLVLDPQVELILFRIIQECLQNVVKHSKATSIKVDLNFIEQFLTLRVKDDGTGFSSSQFNGDGSGLSNIKNRCKLINAKLQITSSPGNGTAITIELPVPQTEAPSPLIS